MSRGKTKRRKPLPLMRGYLMHTWKMLGRKLGERNASSYARLLT